MMIVALDPLLSSDIGFSVVAVMLLKVVLAFALLMVSVMLVIWFERKIVADMHNRVWPSLAGPWGILQTLADGIKLFFKEDLLPERADRVVFRLAPYLSLVPAFYLSQLFQSVGISQMVEMEQFLFSDIELFCK